MKSILRSLVNSRAIYKGHSHSFVRAFSSSTSGDYYSLLGASRSDSADALKKKYRQLAKKYHPDSSDDKSEESHKKFQEISEAYNVLKDPEQRKKYDSMSHDQYQQYKSTGYDPNNMGFGGAGDFSFNDIFDEFFSGGRSRRRSRTPGTYQPPKIKKDITVKLKLSFWEAVLGATKQVNFKVTPACGTCNGTGLKDSKAEMQKCSVCQGLGMVTREIKQGYQMFQFQEECQSCGGLGFEVKNKCGTCKGDGLSRSTETRTETVQVPPGVQSSQIYRLDHSGQNGGSLNIIFEAEEQAMATTQAGDRCVLQIGPQAGGSFLHAAKNVLTIDREVPFATSLLGGSIDVVGGQKKDIEVNLKPGTKDGDVLRLKGRGIPGRYNGQAGDAYLRVHVNLPKNLTERQKEIITEFQTIEDSK